MEDVQQRRQRLAAMREEAAMEESVDAIAPGTTLAPGNSLTLPNPMMDLPPGTAVGPPTKSAGFDFYTDPLTAFTNAKRRKPAVGAGAPGRAPLYGPGGVQAPPWQPTHGAPPFFQPPPMHLAQPPPPPFSGIPGWQPIPYQPPFIAPGPSPPPAYPMGQPQTLSPHSHGRGRDMNVGGRGRGLDSRTGGRGGYGNNFPGPGSGYSSSNNSNAWNSGRGAPYSGGYSARGGSARGQGRGGQRGGRTSSAKEQPHLFFKKSMVEDPWKQLEEKFSRTRSN